MKSVVFISDDKDTLKIRVVPETIEESKTLSRLADGRVSVKNREHFNVYICAWDEGL